MAAAAQLECGCTGIRKCLLCEGKDKFKCLSINTLEKEHSKRMRPFTFCILCGRTLPTDQKCTHHDLKAEEPEGQDCAKLEGITVIPDFVSDIEEQTIATEIDRTIWKPSQSGRRKQDFGPQVNFKKRRLKFDNFTGLPQFSQTLIERMWIQVPALSDFQPVELCNLEYIPDRGSSIDPHFDDFWVWGERLVTLNLLSDSVLTFANDKHKAEVAVPMPRKSLIIVKGEARYKWKHAIKRQDIVSRRIAMTLRELSQEFCEGGKSFSIGSELMKRALTFQGKSVQVNIKDHKC